jgi:hypothetical protein
MNNVLDGEKGNWSLLRSTVGQKGGPVGINSNMLVQSDVGREVTSLEWNIYAKLNNYADKGENVAVYGQANSLGLGTTWGACFEVCDMGEKNAPCVGTEITMNMAGVDNGNRIGLDVTINDARKWRGKGQQTIAEASVGVRVNAEHNDPSQAKFSWRVAFEGWGFRQAGVSLIGSIKDAVAVMVGGAVRTILDLRRCTHPTLLEMSSGSGCFVYHPEATKDIGYLRIIIDGSEYAIPVRSTVPR